MASGEWYLPIEIVAMVREDLTPNPFPKGKGDLAFDWAVGNPPYEVRDGKG